MKRYTFYSREADDTLGIWREEKKATILRWLSENVNNVNQALEDLTTNGQVFRTAFHYIKAEAKH